MLVGQGEFGRTCWEVRTNFREHDVGARRILENMMSKLKQSEKDMMSKLNQSEKDMMPKLKQSEIRGRIGEYLLGTIVEGFFAGTRA